MAITICTITGNVKNLLGSAVENCTLRVSALSPFFHTGTWISGEVGSVVTDGSGSFSIGVIETETVAQKLSFTFEYYDGVSNRKLKRYTVLVPNQASALLSDLVAANTPAPALSAYPASNVTVSAISGLTSTDAQDALAELETQVQAKQDAGAYLTGLTGDVTASGPGAAAATVVSVGGSTASSLHTSEQAANAATSVNTASAIVKRDASGNFSAGAITAALTGNVTGNLTGNVTGNCSGTAATFTGNLTGDVTSTGMATTIGAGKVTDSMVATAAAIALSKLASLTTSKVLVSDGSGIISASTITSTALGFLDATSSIQTQLNAKQATGNYITALTGDVTASGPGSSAATISGLARSKLASGTLNQVIINDASGLLSSEAQLAVSRGGTGIASGTSGGVPYFSGSTTLASSGALTANAVILGGGAGAAPTSVSGLGTAGQILTSNGAGLAPTFQDSAAAPTIRYWTGYQIPPSAWTATSTTFADPTALASGDVTQVAASGLTVTAYKSGANFLPGIVFTPDSSTSAYLITATVMPRGPTAVDSSIRMWDGTTVLDWNAFRSSSTTSSYYSLKLSAIYAPGSTSAKTISLQVASLSGAVTIVGDGAVAGQPAVRWAIHKLT